MLGNLGENVVHSKWKRLFGLKSYHGNGSFSQITTNWGLNLSDWGLNLPDSFPYAPNVDVMQDCVPGFHHRIRRYIFQDRFHGFWGSGVLGFWVLGSGFRF